MVQTSGVTYHNSLLSKGWLGAMLMVPLSAYEPQNTLPCLMNLALTPVPTLVGVHGGAAVEVGGAGGGTTVTTPG